MVKVVGYTRVSTEEQAVGGVSLDLQEAKIRAYAKLEDMELVKIVEDAGLSGCSVKHRPGLQRVLEMVQQREVEVVIVFKLDRLARNTLETLEISRLLDRKGAALHSITERLDTASAIGRFFFTLLASLAEMERALISERIKAAMERKRQKGQACGGNPPYGSTIQDGMLVPEDQERSVIEQICRLRSKRLTIHEIVDNLDRGGIRNRQGRPFGKSQIHVLIKRHAA